MTLCTEWLPEEIVARKICTPKDSAVIRHCESKSRAQKRTWQQYFIIDYKVAEKISDKRSLCKDLREDLNSGDADRLPELKNFVRDYALAEIDFYSCARKKFSANNFKSKYPTLTTILQIIFDERKTNPNYRRNFYGFLHMVDYSKISALTANLSDEQLLQIFNLDREQVAKKSLTPTEKSENLLDNREQEYRKLFRQKLISLKPDVDTALKILRNYQEIRCDRNQINHANATASKTIADIKPMIENYLDALERAST